MARSGFILFKARTWSEYEIEMAQRMATEARAPFKIHPEVAARIAEINEVKP